ncbi:MAG TPA: hypothetical protein VFK41_05395 [Nocardioidaceae bacterium]|nr:hypothetical protein [Nocardioidaceae bacterium]
MTPTSPRRRAALAVLAVGCAVAFLGDLALYTFDDTCPQWEDEGPMAAPGSPYSRVMCGPGDEPPFVWACYAGVVLAVAAVIPLVRRRLRPGLARVLMVLVLIIPISVIGLLHVSLPRDCLTGRTDSGDCGRDRELR